MIGSTGKMPNYTRHDADYRRTRLAPQITIHDGKSFLTLHAASFTVGLVVKPGQDPADGDIAMTTWCDGPDGPGQGMALTFTPDDGMLDMIVGALVQFRDAKREAASKLASAALAKAGGK